MKSLEILVAELTFVDVDDREEDEELREEELTEVDVLLLVDEVERVEDDEEVVLTRVEVLETVEDVVDETVVYGGRDTCLL